MEIERKRGREREREKERDRDTKKERGMPDACTTATLTWAIKGKVGGNSLCVRTAE